MKVKNPYYDVPNSENVISPRNNNKIVTPERMSEFYGTDDYEWNHYKLPTGNVYEFPNDKFFIKKF